MHAEVLHDQLGAVVARPHRHPVRVEDGRHVVGVGMVEQEGHHPAALVGGRPEKADALHGRHPLERVCEHGALVFGERGVPDGREVVGGRPHPHRAGHVGGAGFELVRHLGPCAVVALHDRDHLAAALVGLHPLEQLAPSPERADPGGPAHLVARDGVEVAAERRHVDGEVGGPLRAVHEQEGAGGVDLLGDLRHRVERAQRVRHMGERHHAGARREQPRELVEPEPALVVELQVAQAGSGAGGGELPRHQVGVVLLGREHDLVALAEEGVAPGARHQVDRLGGAARPDHLGGIGGAQEAGHLPARALVGVGRPARQLVDAPVHVGVVVPVIVRDRVYDRVGFLGGGGVVQVDQRLAVDVLLQGREVAPRRGGEGVRARTPVAGAGSGRRRRAAHFPASTNTAESLTSVG